jgi:hypothetical protein
VTAFRKISDPARIADLAVRSAQAGDQFHPPFIRAAMMGVVDCVFLRPGSRVPARFLDPVGQRKPIIIILGGDGAAPCGPAGFPQATRLLRWCRWAMLHGAGGLPWHAELALQAAHPFRRVVIAECTSAILPQWVAMKERIAAETPGLIIAVPEGHPQHPRNTAPAGVVMQ